MTDLNPIPTTEVLYRALLKRKCIDEDTGEVSPEAYFIRTDSGGNPTETGLSVCLASKCIPKDCCSDLNKRFGVVSLSVEYIRSIGLDVEPDPPPPEHALIIKVPIRKDNPVAAERFARLLAKGSEFQWRP